MTRLSTVCKFELRRTRVSYWDTRLLSRTYKSSCRYQPPPPKKVLPIFRISLFKFRGFAFLKHALKF